jgi:hypothetical protein
LEEVQEGAGTKGQEPVSIDEVICTILHEYPTITLSGFTASFKDGGLTEPQVETLYYETIKRHHAHYRVIASFHGIKLSDSTSSSSTDAVNPNELPPGISNPKTFVFGDPKEYENLSEEQRAQMTQDMVDNHKNWVSSQSNKSLVR